MHFQNQNVQDDQRIFPLGYTRVREIVKTAGKKIGIIVEKDKGLQIIVALYLCSINRDEMQYY